MADSTPPPALPDDEQRAAEGLLTRALGEPAEVQSAEPLWDRGHVLRLHLTSGRAAILKRKRTERPIGTQLFGDELAALDYLNAMPVPVAPRLLGADTRAGLLLMEDLGDGATMADSLMGAGRGRVQAELIAYARALGSLHAWSIGHASEAAGDGTVPRLRATAIAMLDRLTERWAGIRIPDYPSLARAGSALAQVPAGWQPQP